MILPQDRLLITLLMLDDAKTPSLDAFDCLVVIRMRSKQGIQLTPTVEKL